ncbi:MAG: hypothetical protein Q9170_005490 [Blastenia crenularia]
MLLSSLLFLLPVYILLVQSTQASPNSALPSTTPPPPGNRQEDDDVCPNYTICSQRGLSYWNSLLKTLADPDTKDKPDSSALFHQHYKTKFDGILPADATLKRDLVDHDISLDHLDIWSTDSVPGGPFAPYENIFDTADGAIIARANFRVWDKAKEKLSWSELMYQTWRAASAHASSVPGHPKGGPISNLKYVVQRNVLNRQTKAVMRTMYTALGYSMNAGDTVWKKWTEGETPHYFYALVGTDNVKGTVWMLNDHAVEMGRKVVGEIWTRWDRQGPDIW